MSACVGGGGNAYCSAVGTPPTTAEPATNTGSGLAAGGDVCAALWRGEPTAGVQVGGFVSIDGLLDTDSANIVTLVNEP